MKKVEDELRGETYGNGVRLNKVHVELDKRTGKNRNVEFNIPDRSMQPWFGGLRPYIRHPG
jgi:hypothetical protein